MNKQCITCKDEFPHTLEFFFRRKGDVLRNECKSCMKVRANLHINKDKAAHTLKRREIGKRYYLNNTDKVRRAGRLKSVNQKLRRFKSDMTFDEMFDSQQGKCGICFLVLIHPRDSKGLTPQSACLDHDHVTGKVRGLLCSSCNKGLGLFTDNTDKLLSAINYLTYYESN